MHPVAVRLEVLFVAAVVFWTVDRFCYPVPKKYGLVAFLVGILILRLAGDLAAKMFSRWEPKLPSGLN